MQPAQLNRLPGFNAVYSERPSIFPAAQLRNMASGRPQILLVLLTLEPLVIKKTPTIRTLIPLHFVRNT